MLRIDRSDSDDSDSFIRCIFVSTSLNVAS